MTKIIKSIPKWQTWRQQITRTIGLVTTMGNLHAGHESLLARSKQENDITVLSIFVNPTQFDNPGDLTNYPRTFEQDVVIAEKIGVDCVLAPDYKALYPDDYRYKVAETELSQIMEGKERLGHFDGMLTIVMKLLLLVKATRTYFGEKDWQQLQLVTGMAKAFFVGTEVVPCATVRDNNDLALSSRNSRLTPAQYDLALNFPRLLRAKESVTVIRKQLEQLGFEVEYIEEHAGRRVGAVKLGEVRLIDNVEVK